MSTITYNVRLFSSDDTYNETHGLVDAYYGLTREQAIALLPTLPTLAAGNRDIDAATVQTLLDTRQMMVLDVSTGTWTNTPTPGLYIDLRHEAYLIPEKIADFVSDSREAELAILIREGDCSAENVNELKSLMGW